DEARVKKPEIDLAVLKLQGMLGRHPVRNRYNLEVLLSLAYFERHFVKMMLGLEEVESLCVRASEAFSERDARRATGHLAAAHSLVKNILAERAGMWEKLKSVWERSRFEKGRSVDGREFVHVLDDLKDHFADRRPGLEYMLAPYERMDLQGWNRKLADFIRSIASSHGLEAPRLGE
ncbi:MAG: hypothetical protein U9N45_05235, partial [Gemmatimonadota bacterium]|nr:hypothetical protein [Gemmatimonadota bacterium]